MRRFYRLDVQPDLFGGFLLLKQWGRIGAGGRIMAERYDAEAPALDALQRQAERKRRRGYATRFPQKIKDSRRIRPSDREAVSLGHLDTALRRGSTAGAGGAGTGAGSARATRSSADRKINGLEFSMVAPDPSRIHYS